MARQDYTANGSSKDTTRVLARNIAIESFVLGINPRFLLPDWVSADTNGVHAMRSQKYKDALSPYFPHISESDTDAMDDALSPLSRSAGNSPRKSPRVE